MYRLAELTDSRRQVIGWGLLLVGMVGVAVGVWWVHYSSFPVSELVDGETVPVVLNEFNWVPRGPIWKGLGYLAGFGASQMMVIGALFIFVLNQRLTWARAAFAAFVTWMELVIIFAIVPSEWLTFAQTDLNWSSQRIAFFIPTWLVLGNEVDISWAVLKDSISMGYHLVMLGAGAVLGLQIQKIHKGRPASADRPQPKSPYGRPLVKGDV